MESSCCTKQHYSVESLHANETFMLKRYAECRPSTLNVWDPFLVLKINKETLFTPKTLEVSAFYFPSLNLYVSRLNWTAEPKTASVCWLSTSLPLSVSIVTTSIVVNLSLAPYLTIFQKTKIASVSHSQNLFMLLKLIALFYFKSIFFFSFFVGWIWVSFL